MKEAGACFIEVEVTQKRRMSCKNRQMLDSKHVNRPRHRNMAYWGSIEEESKLSKICCQNGIE